MVKKILIMAAGTGGHIFPALAIAHELQQRHIDVAWLGTYEGLENQLIPKEHIHLYRISINGLRGHRLLRKIVAPFKILKAIFQSIKIIKQYQPDVVLAMGGFVSGPGGIASWLLRKPLVLHEQNAVLGLTNKLLSPFATLVMSGFPTPHIANRTSQTANRKPHIAYTGTPVRQAILQIPEPAQRMANRQGPIRLLVFGGSQGALSFSQIIPEALSKLSRSIQIDVWHHAGKKNYEMTKKSYEKFGIEARIEPFIEDMPKAYEWADCVISRSGASTIAELSTIGLAAILVPYPHHKDQQQKHNAVFLAQANAAILMEQQAFTPDHLATVLNELLSDRQRLLKMAECGRSLRKSDATQLIVQKIEELNEKST